MTVIRLPSKLPKGLLIPGHVFRQGKFKFEPRTFFPEDERLEDTLLSEQVQIDSLQRFKDNPSAPVYYGVGGSPDDNKAKYFAAYLSYLHYQKVPNASVLWQPIYGGFSNPLLENTEYKSPPTLLVLYNLATCATTVKLDKLRDILDKYSDIPRIVVNAGIDPISFASVKLNVPINSMAYFMEKIVRRPNEVL